MLACDDEVLAWIKQQQDKQPRDRGDLVGARRSNQKAGLMKDRVDRLAQSAKSRSKPPAAWAAAAAISRSPRRRPRLPRRPQSDISTLHSPKHLNLVATSQAVDVTDLVRTQPNDPDWISHVSRQLIRKRPPQISAAAGATVKFLILRQDVDFTKLFLYLVDPLGTVRESFSVARGYHYHPTSLARYNREFDRWRAVDKGRERLPKNPDQVGARNFLLSQR
jgi:hypothetical protein